MDRSDGALIQDTLGGTTDAFDELMRRYERLIFKVAYSFGGSYENALDITQTVFLKAFDKLNTFRSDSSFKTWLLRITYNEGINWSKSLRNLQDPYNNLEPTSRALSAKADQESNLLLREQRQMIKRGLESLNDRYRTAILLRYVHEMSIREIASVLQCSENMTKNILFRSLRKLKRTLEKTV